jgi:hypothetical protein
LKVMGSPLILFIHGMKNQVEIVDFEARDLSKETLVIKSGTLESFIVQYF